LIIPQNGKIPCWGITFHKKNLPLVLKLMEYIGGDIRYKEKENAIVLNITKSIEFYNIIILLNNKLRTPKIDQFNKLID